MGMLEGKVVGEVMAIKIAEIGAQGEFMGPAPARAI